MSTLKKAVRIAVTGAAGQIAYSLLFRLARGELLGPDQPVILQLLEITPALGALGGVVMELHDCAFPLLHDVTTSDDPHQAFADADYIFLVGARPRQKGQERRQLLEANGSIFTQQGKAINETAARHVRVLVVGNPANTNALILASNAPRLQKNQFSGMVRLDQNRAIGLLAKHLNHSVGQATIKKVAIWGNHSPTMFTDLRETTVQGKKLTDTLDMTWYQKTFIPSVAQRGTIVLNARGASSAASAASAALDHMRHWALGTPAQDWSSMSVWTDQTYAPLIPEGLMCGLPCICKNNSYDIVPNISFSGFFEDMIRATVQELQEERDAVRHMLS